MQILPEQVVQLPAGTQKRTPVEEKLMAGARAIEAEFLSEMLSYAGFGAAQKEFGGGIGEDQFSSFLRQEQAKLMVAKGGIGLAEQLFRSMTRKSGNDV